MNEDQQNIDLEFNNFLELLAEIKRHSNKILSFTRKINDTMHIIFSLDKWQNEIEAVIVDSCLKKKRTSSNNYTVLFTMKIYNGKDLQKLKKFIENSEFILEEDLFQKKDILFLYPFTKN